MNTPLARSRLVAAAVFAAGVAVVPGTAANGSGARWNNRVSVGSNGEEGSLSSAASSLSRGGRYVAFTSFSNTLVPGDTNGASDVFRHDRTTGDTVLVSSSSAGVVGNAGSSGADVSATGRFIAFASSADNFTADTNGAFDVFVKNLDTGALLIASVSSGGVLGNDDSVSPAISGNGNFIAFSSAATNLVPGDTNGSSDVFVRDVAAGITVRVSVPAAGGEADSHSVAPTVSDDGRFVSFYSHATNLVPGDTNGVADVFRKNLVTGAIVRVSESTGGAQGNGTSDFPSASADGRTIAFRSAASNLVAGDTNGELDIFVRHVPTGVTSRVSVSSGGVQASGGSDDPSLSPNGLRVAFQSLAGNLVAGDTNGVADVFLHSAGTGVTERISAAWTGAQLTMDAQQPDLTDGCVVTYESFDPNVVGGITNTAADVFVSDFLPPTELYCAPGVTASGCQATLSVVGVASLSVPSGYFIDANGVEGDKSGIFYWSTHGRQAKQWGNGTSFQCVVPPVKRTGFQPKNGTPGQCDGILSVDFNSWMWTNPGKGPSPGVPVQIQCWFRDPLNTSNQTTSLSDALEFPVLP